MICTIKRSEWLRGEGHEVSRLFRSSDGKKCCAGFLCLQSGISLNSIKDECGIRKFMLTEKPVWLSSEEWEDVQKLKPIGAVGEFLENAYAINDSTSVGDKEREERLINLGKEHNVEFVFVD